MPCTPFRSSDGKVSGFVCTRGRRTLPCVVCGKPHTKLCDGPPSTNIKSSSGTCSAPLCDAHAFHVAPGKDYCPKHHPDEKKGGGKTDADLIPPAGLPGICAT